MFYEESPGNEAYSYGSWKTEKESVKYLKDLLTRAELFNIYHEIDGHLLFCKPGKQHKGMTIDLILIPKPKLIDAGWQSGAIGIECKKSGIKINEPFAQSEDYCNTVWKLVTRGGFLLMCEYSFLWPWRRMHHFHASQMAQKKLGTLDFHKSQNALRFYCGESKVLKYYFSSGKIEFGKLDFGNKSGSH